MAETNPVLEGESAAQDWRGLGELIGLVTERLTAPVEGVHRAIADRWFALAGPKTEPIARAYDRLTANVYRSVRLAGSGLGRAVGSVAGHRMEPVPLWRSSPGRGIQAVVNAVWGDELARTQSHFGIEQGLRDKGGRPIRLDPESLESAFPEATARLAVLLHGLGETEACWQRQASDQGGALGFADRLAGDSFTPLLVRYNTGKHVSENGASLAELLDQLVGAWPVLVEEVALVGSSMGGLVARSAIHAGVASEHGWIDRTRHVVTLGSPHLGSPLEKAANLVSVGLRSVSETRPISEFVDRRSAGIKDLRFGAIRREDWIGGDPDELLKDRVVDVQLPDHITLHVIAGVVTADPAHPLGRLVGDLIVRAGSGIGRGRVRQIHARDVRVLGGRRHFALANDPDVQQHILDWLSGDNERECSTSQRGA